MTDLIKNTKGNSLKEEWTAYICREILRVSNLVGSFLFQRNEIFFSGFSDFVCFLCSQRLMQEQREPADSH